jgi:hypothetical protein
MLERGENINFQLLESMQVLSASGTVTQAARAGNWDVNPRLQSASAG